MGGGNNKYNKLSRTLNYSSNHQVSKQTFTIIITVWRVSQNIFRDSMLACINYVLK